MKKVNIGVIGCGVIGNHHMEAVQKSEVANLMAVADLIEEKVNTAEEKYGANRKYKSGAELLRDPEIDAVVMPMPTTCRSELVLEAFTKGKHVLIEKPVAMNRAELRGFIQARGDLVAGCCSCRYSLFESSRAVTEFIASGRLGNIRLVRSRNTTPVTAPPEKERPAWRMIKALNGGGILVNWGCYDLDYLLGLTGWTLKPVSVFAKTWPTADHFMDRLPAGSDADTHFTAMIRCQNGTVINFERGEGVVSQSEQAWQIVGDKGSLQLMMIPTKGKKIVFDGYNEKGLVSETIWEGEDHADRLHSGPVNDFVRAILEGDQPKTGLEKAMIVQQITDAIYESSETGKAIEIVD